MLSIQAMGTGTTEQTHRAPALLHTLWAILYKRLKKCPSKRRAPCRCCKILTADISILPGSPFMCTADNCHFTLVAPGDCHALTHPLVSFGVTTFRAS